MKILRRHDNDHDDDHHHTEEEVDERQYYFTPALQSSSITTTNNNNNTTTTTTTSSLQQQQEHILQIYRDEIHYQWYTQHQSLIMGSEGLDYMTSNDNDNDHQEEEEDLNTQFFHRVMSIMPNDQYRSYTDVIVKYRSPRIYHLISLWKELSSSTLHHRHHHHNPFINSY